MMSLTNRTRLTIRLRQMQENYRYNGLKTGGMAVNEMLLII